MQVTETSAEGLKHEFRIVISAGELEDKVVGRLDELNRTLRIPGFRPGKVPLQILRRRFGASVLGEVVESTVQDSSADTIRDRNLRPALPPKVDIVSFGEGADLEYKMMVEVLPEIPEPDFRDLGIERLVVDIPEASIDAALQRIAEQQRKTQTVSRPAADGDIVVADIEGRIGGEEIAGAGGKDRHIVLGSAGLVPGFEEQLIGVTAGEQREVRVTFPADYAVAHLAGKEAVFTVAVKEVQERLPAVVDDELAVAVGLENLAELRQEVRQQMERDYAAASRLRLKRALLDTLAQRYEFPVPPGMVELEFGNIWAQHEAEKQLRDRLSGNEAGAAAEGAAGDEPAETSAAPDAVPPAADTARFAEGAAPTGAEPEAQTAAEAAQGAPAGGAETSAGADPEEAEKAEYRKIAERRVRLGLLLAEVGNRNNITVTQDELNQAITREVRRHPGYERQTLDYYRQNPDAVANLRAPIFEDKVVDFIVELAKVPERRVSPEELLALSGPDDSDLAAATGPEPAETSA